MESYIFFNRDNYYKGKMSIGICPCLIEGCDDIVTEIENSDNYVSWKIFNDKHSEMYKIYTFDKAGYSKAIEEAKSGITQKEKFIQNYED